MNKITRVSNLVGVDEKDNDGSSQQSPNQYIRQKSRSVHTDDEEFNLADNLDDEIAAENNLALESVGELRATKAFANPNRVTPLREREIRDQYPLTKQIHTGPSSGESLSRTQ